jgi:primary-amine oxidase
MTVLLRPRNFFTQNPAMDVPPAYSSTPTQVKEGREGWKVGGESRLAF